MLSLDVSEIRDLIDHREVLDAMREAVISHSQGATETPLPMHLDIPAAHSEVHVKASHLKGSDHFVVKVAGSFPLRSDGTSSQSNGVVILFSARNGEPVAYFTDNGYLTDVRTAALSAMTVRELGRNDSTLGIIGAGYLARMQAVMHAEVLPISTIWIWGRTPGRVEAFVRDLKKLLPGVDARPASSPSHLAKEAKLLVTVTPSRGPVLHAGDLQPGTHVSAVGADAPGKQELDPRILREAALLLVDSVEQCRRTGELQHAPEAAGRAVEIGRYCINPVEHDRNGISVADFTGLGIADFSMAEYCFRKKRPADA